MRARLRALTRSYRRPFLIGSSIFLTLILVIGYTGFYPIVIVNGDWITARKFRLHLSAAENYESQKQSTSTINSVLKDKDIVVSVLEGLIEAQFIEKGARLEFADRLGSLKTQRLNDFLSQKAVMEEEGKKYGFNLDQFKKEILEPQVTRDLFSGRLFLKSMRLEDWLLEQKKTGSVTLLSQVFYWDGREVQVR